MKKVMMAVVFAGVAFGLAACTDDLKCNTPAIFTQMENIKKAAAPTDCKEKSEAISKYIEDNKSDLDEAFTKWDDDKQENGVCYIRDAFLYANIYSSASELNKDLKKCAETGSTEASAALDKLGTVAFWDQVAASAADAAVEEAKNGTED